VPGTDKSGRVNISLQEYRGYEIGPAAFGEWEFELMEPLETTDMSLRTRTGERDMYIESAATADDPAI